MLAHAQVRAPPQLTGELGVPLRTNPWARSAFSVLPASVQSRVARRLVEPPQWANGAPPVAPACPAGMTTGPPDVVGVGASKSGTSWWFSLLSDHPDFQRPVRKELLYFNRWFFQRVREGRLTDADLRAYHDWFPRPEGSIAGEWTPSYLFWHQLPPLLRRAAPGAKILVLLRDPVERFQSDISRRMPRQRLQTSQYRSLANGYYAARLAPWEAEFAPSEIHLAQYEACVGDPAGQLADTYRFVGLDDTYCPPRLLEAVNKTTVKRPIDAAFRRMLVEIYEEDVVALCARYPQIDLRLWPNFAYLAGT